ncbi:MAG TPA: glycosyltransferase family 39 protein, partial [Pirellulaceae bacterium]
LAHKSYQEIIWAEDGFPPLYHLLLRPLLQVAGDDTARWPSVLFGIATCAAVAAIGFHCGGPELATWSTLLAAMLPLWVWHSQEARSYGLTLCCGAWSIWATLRLLDTPSSRGWPWLVFLGSALAGLYSHYFFFILVVMLGIRLAIGADRLPWRQLLIPAGIGIVGSLPLLALVSQDFQTQATWPDRQAFNVTSLGFSYFSLVGGFTLGPSVDDLHVMSNSRALSAFAPWIATMTVILGSLAGFLIRKPSRWPRHAKFLGVLFSGVVVVGLIANAAGVGYEVRYPFWVGVPFAILGGAALSFAWQRPLGRVAGIALFGIMALALANRFTLARYANPDMRSVAATLDSQGAPGDTVIVLSGYMEPVLRYYSPNAQWHSRRMPRLTPPHDRLPTIQGLVREHVDVGAP